MEPRTITLIRYGLLGTLWVFCLITLGLAGNLLSQYSAGFIVPDYLGLNVAISVITMVVTGVSVGIEFFRKGAFTSLVVTELCWAFVLTILWLATAGDTTAIRAGLSCNVVFTDFFGNEFSTPASAQTSCHEAQALIAFSWFNFLLMLGWFVTLLTLTLIGHTRGQTSVWLAPVNGTDFFVRRTAGDKGYGDVPQQQHTGGPVQQQQYTGGPMQQQTAYPPAGYNTSPAVTNQV